MSALMEDTLNHLNDCGCCEGISVKTPIEIYNRPALQAIAYRIGEHPDFLASMLAQLSEEDYPALKALRTRSHNDFSIALLDAWAMVADVLTFYNQYIANESYLRTASERLSVVELARLIGYQPKPGVAASTLLAFTMDDLPGSPEQISLPVGIKVQSTPGQDEQAQMFETVEEVVVRGDWNNIRPRLRKAQIPVEGTTELIFDGLDTQLKSGDGVFYTPVNSNGKNKFATIISVELDQDHDLTRVLINRVKNQSIHGSISTILSEPKPGLPFPAGDYLGKTFEVADLEAESKEKNFNIKDIFEALSANTPSSHSVIVFRQSASIFGHNAPAWNSLPDTLTGEGSLFYPEGKLRHQEEVWPGNNLSHLETMNTDSCPFENVKRTTSSASDNGSYTDTGTSKKSKIFLDNVYKEISVNGFNNQVLLKDEATWGIYKILGYTELTKSCFTVTAKVTRLEVDSSENFDQFFVRNTSAYLQSELIPLAPIPIPDDIPVGNSQELELDGFVDGLYTGQRLLLSGKEINGSGKSVSEFITLDKIEHELVLGGCTRITFSPALQHIYQRESVFINANIVAANHGETVQEVLGSGDATLIYQTFTLKQPPLTHVSANTPTGGVSTLEVRVNELLWHEVDNLLGRGPEERIYITRSDDAGQTIIKFGNGITGSRLPTGQDNVRAVYRKGIGTEGLVDAGQLNLLMSRPLGLQEVTNPYSAEGADNPESYAHAQKNAPFAALTLDRAVSLQDYEDFSRHYEGVAKAMAMSALDGKGKVLFITVAGPEGAPIESDSKVFKNLTQALARFGDPLTRFRIQSYRPATFRLGCKIKVDPDYVTENVLQTVEAVLRLSFSFDSRDFGQPVVISKVYAVIQATPGVTAVDIDHLYRGKTPKLTARIPAERPLIKNNTQLQAAELLTLHPGPLDKLEVMA